MPFCILSTAERAAAMIAKLVNIGSLISVEPDGSDVRLNTNQFFVSTTFWSILLLFLDMMQRVHLLCQYIFFCWVQISALLYASSGRCFKWAIVVCGSMETYLSTHHRFWCHTHITVCPSVSKGRVQKFPLLIVSVLVCVFCVSEIKPVKQWRWPQQDTGHLARVWTRPRGRTAIVWYTLQRQTHYSISSAS